MKVLEFISLVSMTVLCFICSKSDLSAGIIKNKVLGIFAIIAIVIDSVYYGYFARDLFVEFSVNAAFVSAVSLFLFYTHSFAGGDCKMTVVLALLYPARLYTVYNGKSFTLIFAVALAVFAGFVYLLVAAVFDLITKKASLTPKSAANYLLSFLKSYLVATVYVTLANLVFAVFGKFGVNINMWLSVGFCMVLAWCIGKYRQFKNIIAVICASVAVVVISIDLKVFPFSLNPWNYLLVLILLLCRIVIHSTIYEPIPAAQLKKGMILSTMSTLMMQGSITKGLPKLSTEDLKSRLTEEEVESVKIWAKATHTDTLTIIKKVPFAIFIALGFIGYYIFWCVT